MSKEYPATYNKEEREAFDRMRDVVRKAGGDTLVVCNGSGYVLSPVPEITDIHESAEDEYNDGRVNPLLLSFVTGDAEGERYSV